MENHNDNASGIRQLGANKTGVEKLYIVIQFSFYLYQLNIKLHCLKYFFVFFTKADDNTNIINAICRPL